MNTTPLEEQEQIALAQFLDLYLPPYSWCHVPNGGMRHKATAGKLKAQGVKAGVPDVLIFTHFWFELHEYSGLAIELKRVKVGQVSVDQERWLASLALKGWHTATCYGAESAIELVKRCYPKWMKDAIGMPRYGG